MRDPAAEEQLPTIHLSTTAALGGALHRGLPRIWPPLQKDRCSLASHRAVRQLQYAPQDLHVRDYAARPARRAGCKSLSV